MHKTVSVSIGNALFTIEESAYAKLEEYLRSIRKHFGASTDADEIVEDIEGRIAEEFGEKLGQRKKVILLKDVEELIKRMGTIEDFEEFEEGEKDSGSEWKERIRKVRLYRDADNQVIGGVCSGIAKYFDIDPLIIRLLFGLSLFMGGFGFLLYILLWILLPEARTTTEKVEMTGGKITLSAIQKRIDETLPPEKRRNALQKIVSAPVALIRSILLGIGKIFSFIFPLIGRLLGFAILIAASFGVAAATFVLFALLLNPHSPYIGFPLRDAVGAVSYLILLASGYFLVAMPIVMIILAGVSLLTLRSAFRTSTVAGVIGLWFIALTVGGVTAFSVSPTLEPAFERYATEHLKQEVQTYELAGFTGVSVGGSTHLEIYQNDSFIVELEGTEKDRAAVQLEIVNGVLTLDRSFRGDDPCIFFCGHSDLELHVGMPNLDFTRVSGASWASIEGFEEQKVEFQASGSSFIRAEADVQDLTAIISGASYIELTGSGNTLTTDLSGSSTLEAFGFSVDTAEVTVSGASSAFVDAGTAITGKASGSSEVHYRGSDANIDVETSGASETVEHYDEREEESEQW